VTDNLSVTEETVMEAYMDHPLPKTKSRRQNPCPNKEAFGSHRETLMLSAASMSSTVVLSWFYYTSKSDFPIFPPAVGPHPHPTIPA